MAAKKDKKIKLVSTADTGFYYTTTNTTGEKLELIKYDPKARKHVLFKQRKIK